MASPIFAFDVPIRLWRRLRAADATLLAAAVAFNTFFALVPILLALVTAASILGRNQVALDRTMESVALFTPEAVAEFLRELITDTQARVEGSQAIIIAAGVVVALYSGSRAMVAMQRALALVEGMAEHRPRWRIRLIGMGLTLAAATALAGSTLLLVVGGNVTTFIDEQTGVAALGAAFRLLRIPLASIGLFLFLRVLYRWGPPQPLPATSTAAAVGAAGNVAASLGFGLYLSRVDELGATVGALGAVALALLWLYVGALATILGAAAVTSAVHWKSGPAPSRLEGASVVEVMPSHESSAPAGLVELSER